MFRALIALTAVAGLAGCGISEDKYPEKLSQAACAAYEECGYLDSFGGDIESCEDLSRIYTDAQISVAACEYDPAAARDCVNYFKNIDCDADFSTTAEESSPCDDVCGF